MYGRGLYLCRCTVLFFGKIWERIVSAFVVFIEKAGFIAAVSDFADSVFSISDVVYFVSIIAVFVFLSVIFFLCFLHLDIISL